MTNADVVHHRLLHSFCAQEGSKIFRGEGAFQLHGGLFRSRKQVFQENKYFIFHTYNTNNKNISISLDLIFFNKRRMIHHYSISSSEEFVRNTIFKKFLDQSLVYNRRIIEAKQYLFYTEIETLCGEGACNQASVLPIDCFYKIS